MAQAVGQPERASADHWLPGQLEGKTMRKWLKERVSEIIELLRLFASKL
jgi:hypothetical protein